MERAASSASGGVPRSAALYARYGAPSRRSANRRYPPLGEVPVPLLIGCADGIGTSIFGTHIFAQMAQGKRPTCLA